MILKRLSIATIILLLIGLGFSSCETDRYRWERSSLVYDSYDWVPPMQLDLNGVLFPEEITLNIRDIYRSGSGRVEDIRVFDSFFLFTSKQFRNGDRMELKLESSTGRRYGGEMINLGYNTASRSNEFIIDMGDRNYAAFATDLLRDLKLDGSLILYIDGRLINVRQGMDVHFEFNNNLDIEVRD